MIRPCSECPFLRGSPFESSMCRSRAEEIATALRDGGHFPCHKTTEVGGASRGKEMWCAGALGTMENEDGPGAMGNQMARIAARLGLIGDPAELERSELYDSLSAWVETHDP